MTYGYWPTVYAPSAYPLYSYPAYPDPYEAAPPVVIVYIPSQPPAPASPPGRSQEREDPPDSPGASAGSGTAARRDRVPTGTLLAFKSGAVYLTIAEWRSGESIHFVNRDGRQLAMPLETLDLGLTEQLNRERNVEFRLNATE